MAGALPGVPVQLVRPGATGVDHRVCLDRQLLAGFPVHCLCLPETAGLRQLFALYVVGGDGIAVHCGADKVEANWRTGLIPSSLAFRKCF